jgi:hypothetical protein
MDLWAGAGFELVSTDTCLSVFGAHEVMAAHFFYWRREPRKH